MKGLRFSNNVSKIFTLLQVILVSTSITIVGLVEAEEPDNIEIKDDTGFFTDKLKNEFKSGGFDLSRESSTIVSAATNILHGSPPGIRTAATVNNDDGVVRVGSVITANYQIIDLDGDWDGSQSYQVEAKDSNGETYIINYPRTSDTIVWGFREGTGVDAKVYWIEDSDTVEKIVSQNKIHLTVPETINIDGVAKSTLGMSVVYRLIPSTMVGSEPNRAFVDEVLIEDLTKGRLLEPNTDTNGSAIDIDASSITQDTKYGAFDYPGFPDPALVENKSFITDILIKASDGSENNADVQVVIYKANDATKLNILGIASDTNKTLADNQILKPKVYTANEYRAEVKIKDNQGNLRPLRKDEYEDKLTPFTWNVYYPADKECLKTAWNTGEQCVLKEQFKVTDADKSRFNADFVINESGIEVLNYASFKTQLDNSAALVDSKLEASEQGTMVTISFSYEP